MPTLRNVKWKVSELIGGAELFLAFLVGRVPVHRLRLAAYRRVLGMTIGPRTAFHWRAVFFAPRGVRIGNHTIIGNDVFFDGRGGLVIGDNVNIGGHTHIFTRDHDPQDPDFLTRDGAVNIGDRAWIASRSTILPGVTVGEGAVVAAGAVVSADVEPYTIVGGVPARKIGDRTRNLRYTLDYQLPFQ